ncbi:MAG: SlyX family protein [Deltaproteobacteria bacterium]|nr:SlyX family protein [Deltaproteobacteria bacterium]
MDRIEAIEARLAWLEKSLAELDEVVRTTADEMRRLRGEFDAMRDDSVAGADFEKPPHY